MTFALDLSGIQWSAQQRAVFAEIERGDGHVIVEALAGTGKTTTVIECLRRLPRGAKALLCAFNKSIAEELEARAPRGVKVSTLHGLGYSSLMSAWGKAPLDKTRGARHVAIACDELVKSRTPRVRTAPAFERELCSVVSLCKSRLVQGAEDIEREVERSSIPYPDGLTAADASAIVARALDLAIVADGTVGFDDMVYVPAALGLRPRAQYDVVFVDETQDMSRAQLVLAQLALREGGRLVLVGDRNQCHPPGTMIATSDGDVPVEDLISRQHSKGLTLASWNRNAQKMVNGRSFAAATRFYEGVMHKVQIGDRSVSMTSNHKVLARWSNRDAQTCVVYLMYRRGLGYRVGWCKLFSTTEGHKNFHLGIRTRIEKADAVWILKAFDDRTEASAYESIVAARFGLPTLPFEPVHGANHITRASIDDVFSQLKEENGARGESCLRDHGRDPSFPLYPFADSDDGARSRGTVFKTYASNVLPDLMCLPLPDGQNTWGKVDAVHNSLYAGPVFSLNVEKDHSYSANGIVVLNCIYGWRGADTGSMERMAHELDATVLPLSITRRCPRSVVAIARRFVPAFEAAPEAPAGTVRTCSLASVDWSEGDLVVSRLNAPLTRCALAAIRAGKRARIQGRDFAQSFRFWVQGFGARRAADLVQCARGWVQRELAKLGDGEQDAAEDLIDRVETLDALAEGCATVEEVLLRLDNLFSDEGPGLLFSSTHRAKGMERERVFVLAWTFRPSKSEEESNLAYVAITRAKSELVLVTNPDRPIADTTIASIVERASR